MSPSYTEYLADEAIRARENRKVVFTAHSMGSTVSVPRDNVVLVAHGSLLMLTGDIGE